MAEAQDIGLAPSRWLKENGGAVARMLAETGLTRDRFDVQVLKRSSGRLVLKVGNGDRSFVVKAFDPSLAESARRLRRETTMLHSLRGQHLAPRLVGYSEPRGFFLSEHIPATTAQSALDAERPEKICHGIGAWFARFSGVAAKGETQTNWHAYLSQYPALAPLDRLAAHTGFLKSLPITEQRVAKNDAELGNFLVDAEGRIHGIDFEAAALKPVGWDILLTARVLSKLPKADAAIEALLDGWATGAGPVAEDKFRDLTHRFVDIAAAHFPPMNRSARDRYLTRFNARSKTKASRVFTSPSATQEMTPNQVSEVARLRRHLVMQASAVKADTDAAQTPSEAGSTDIVQPLCATCAGRCCKRGAENFAFLKPKDIARTFGTRGAVDPQAIADYYLSFMPQNHVAGSCLFHTEEGCALPVKARSSTCTTFLCPDARGFANAARSGSLEEPVLLVSIGNRLAHRARLLTGGTTRAVALETVQ